MTTTNNVNQTLQERLESIKQLNRGRYDYVLERAKKPQPSIDNACRSFGKTRAWYYELSKDEQEELEYLADQLHKNHEAHAFCILTEATAEAAKVQSELLHNKDARVRQTAAKEVLDRTIGKAADKTDVNVSGQVSIVWKPHKPEN